MTGGYALTPALWTIAAVFALLTCASVAVLAYAGLRPNEELGELRLRLRSWWAIVAVSTCAMLASESVFVAFLALVSFLGLKEFVALAPTRRADRGAILWAFVAIPVQYYWVASGSYEMFLVYIPVNLFVALPICLILAGEPRGYLRAVGTLHWGLMATVFSLSHIGFLLVEPPGATDGVALVLYVVGLAQLNDVAQYVVGKTLGHRRVVPRISPGKTWEGLLGGVATTIALAIMLAPWLTPFGIWEAGVAGVLIGVGGFAGDAALSALKRDLGAKDWGCLLPGHGGVLDRVDSLIFTAPLFFHFTRLLHG